MDNPVKSTCGAKLGRSRLFSCLLASVLQVLGQIVSAASSTKAVSGHSVLNIGTAGWYGHVWSPFGLHFICSSCNIEHFSSQTLRHPQQLHPFLLNQLHLRAWGWVSALECVTYYVSGCLRLDVLSVSKVESTEQRVVLWRRLASLILIQEDRWTSHFHAQLLDSLLVVKGQQEGLEAWLGAHCGQNGEVLRKNTSCTMKRGGVEETAQWVSVIVTEDMIPIRLQCLKLYYLVYNILDTTQWLQFNNVNVPCLSTFLSNTNQRITVKRHILNTLTSWISFNCQLVERLNSSSYQGITVWWGHWSGPAWQFWKLSPALMLFGLCRVLMFVSLLRGNFEILILLARPLALLIRGADKTQVRLWHWFLKAAFGSAHGTFNTWYIKVFIQFDLFAVFHFNSVSNTFVPVRFR